MDDGVVVALFRHGLTELNKQKSYMGWTDAPICEEARIDLTNISFHPSPYDTVVTSDLKRCLQTSNLLFPEHEPIPMREFREMNFGPWEGKTYADLAGDPQFESWNGDYMNIKVPGVESFSDFSKRIEAGWKRVSEIISSKEVDKMAIVTHGGVIRYLLSTYGHIEKEFWEWKVPHGNGFELVWDSSAAFRRGDRCTLLREVLLTENQNG
jgi:alpha-ribazole phosphatase